MQQGDRGPCYGTSLLESHIDTGNHPYFIQPIDGFNQTPDTVLDLPRLCGSDIPGV